MKRDKHTYDAVRDKYDEFTELQKDTPMLQRERPRGLPEQRPYSPAPDTGSDMGKTVFMAIGVGIGLLLLALSAYAFYTAASWSDIARNGAQVGYSLVGFFLLIAGVGGIIATLNHNLRVLARPGGHH